MTQPHDERGRWFSGWSKGLLALICVCLIVGTPSQVAWADDPLEFAHTAAEIRVAQEGALSLTDPQAAEELPHRDLGRSESEELLKGVFGPLIEAPAGIFDGLQVEKFLAGNAALIADAEVDEAFGKGAQLAGEGESFLLESTTPLGTEGAGGHLEAVDLGLENVFGGLRPINPLVDVAIPSELGDGIVLPEAGIKLELEGAPAGRNPSTVVDTVAFYPNVAEDTDLAVAPGPNGVETLTQLRSPDAPTTQTFRIYLPAGAELSETADGGAVAVRDGERLATIRPPTALDAAGEPVPAQMSVQGDFLQISVSPDGDTKFPIALDPFLEDNYNWYYSGYAGWSGHNTGGWTNAFRAPDTGCSTYCFLRTSAMSGTYETNTQSYWEYRVPRFEKDWEEAGTRPSSWIQSYAVGNITLATAGDWTPSPGALFAVSDQNGAWRSASWYPPNISGSYAVNLNSDHTGKLASFGLFSNARTWIANERYLLTGEAQVVLGDDAPPAFGSLSSPGWVDTQAKPFNVTISDAGLGVHWLEVRKPNGESIGATAIDNYCVGTVRSICPRTWKGAQEGHTVHYWPGLLPQGTNNVKLEALDSVGNSSSTTLQLKVDHTAPELALAGSLTEQASIGTTLPQYTLHVAASDGTTESPQSGVASVEVKVDGAKVKEWTPGCTTQSCQFSGDWTLASSSYAVGQHKAEVVATDAVGINSTVRTVDFAVTRDETPPQISAGGGLVSGPAGWIEQQSYAIGAQVTDPGGYGATNLELLIDGAQAKQATQTCPAGGCSLGREFTIDASTYQGGSHTVKAVAKDGAGNTASTKTWIVNLVPKGTASAEEVEDTIEASEGTSPEVLPIAPNTEVIDPEEIREGNDPGWELIEGQLQSTGTAVGTSTGEEVGDGFTIKAPAEGVMEGAPEGGPISVEISPVETLPGAGSPELVEDDVASTIVNSYPSTDTVLRPEYDGLWAFEVIRNAESPTSYSWDFKLYPGQTLKQINSETAGLYYEDGTTAMVITAGPARGADGKEVPTDLEVDEAGTVTLNVNHRSSGVVYPVMSGAGFETGYMATVTSAPVQEGPPPPPEEAGNDVEIWVSSPQYAPSGEDGATASASGPPYKTYSAQDCEKDVYIPFPIEGCSVWKQRIKGFFWFNGNQAWWKDGQRPPKCPSEGTPGVVYPHPFFCDFVGPNHQKYGGGYHITSQVWYNVDWLEPLPISHEKAITVRMFGSGGVYGHNNGCVCNPSLKGQDEGPSY